MPIEAHPSFPAVPGNQRIWRYMDLAKLLSLLTKRELWFTNAAVLAKEDPQEGLLTRAVVEHRSWSCLDAAPPSFKAWLQRTEFFGCNSLEEKFERAKNNAEYAIISSFFVRRQMYINSWHIGERESAAMWKVYGASNLGVAITSTPSRLNAALSESSMQLFAGRIRYINFEVDRVDWSNAFNAVMVKRDSFAFETEFRVVYWNPSTPIPSEVKPLMEQAQPNFWGLNPDTKAELIRRLQSTDLPAGVVASCNLNELIDGIWISPSAPDWYLDTIARLCDIIGFSGKVRRSTLLDTPVF